MTTIGERIKARRELLKMSQQELAEKLGYKSRSSINKIELGEQNLTQSKIYKIATALYTTPEYIMGWNNDPEAQPQEKKNIIEILAPPTTLQELLGFPFIKSDLRKLLEIAETLTPEQIQLLISLAENMKK